MHIARVAVGCYHHVEDLFDLGGIGGGKTLHGKSKMPDITVGSVGAANAAGKFAFEVIGVVFAQNELTGVLIDGVVNVNTAKIGKAIRLGTFASSVQM